MTTGDRRPPTGRSDPPGGRGPVPPRGVPAGSPGDAEMWFGPAPWPAPSTAATLFEPEPDDADPTPPTGLPVPGTDRTADGAETATRAMGTVGTTVAPSSRTDTVDRIDTGHRTDTVDTVDATDTMDRTGGTDRADATSVDGAGSTHPTEPPGWGAATGEPGARPVSWADTGPGGSATPDLGAGLRDGPGADDRSGSDTGRGPDAGPGSGTGSGTGPGPVDGPAPGDDPTTNAGPTTDAGPTTNAGPGPDVAPRSDAVADPEVVAPADAALDAVDPAAATPPTGLPIGSPDGSPSAPAAPPRESGTAAEPSASPDPTVALPVDETPAPGAPPVSAESREPADAPEPPTGSAPDGADGIDPMPTTDALERLGTTSGEIDDGPSAPDHPTTDAGPAAHDGPATDAGPVSRDHPLFRDPTADDLTTTGDDPAPHDRPRAGDDPAARDRPLSGNHDPVVHDRPTTGDDPAADERPTVDERPVVVERPSIDERPTADERPAIDERPIPNERPAADERSIPVGDRAPEERPAVDERPIPADGSLPSPRDGTAAARPGPSDTRSTGPTAAGAGDGPRHAGTPVRPGGAGRPDGIDHPDELAAGPFTPARTRATPLPATARARERTRPGFRRVIDTVRSRPVLAVLVAVVLLGGLGYAIAGQSGDASPDGWRPATTAGFDLSVPDSWAPAPAGSAPMTVFGVPFRTAARAAGYGCRGATFTRATVAGALIAVPPGVTVDQAATAFARGAGEALYSGAAPDVAVGGASPDRHGGSVGSRVEATIRTDGGGGCRATDAIVQVLAVPRTRAADGSVGVAVLIVGGDLGGGPPTPAPVTRDEVTAVVNAAEPIDA